MNDGITVLASVAGMKFKYWDTETGKPRVKLPSVSHKKHYTPLAVAGEKMYGDIDGRLFEFNASNGELLRELKTGVGIAAKMNISSDGKTCASICVSDSNEARVSVIDIEADKTVFTKLIKDEMPSGAPGWWFRVTVDCALSPDGKLLAVSNVNGNIELYSAKTGRLTALLLGHAKLVSALTFTADSTKLYSGDKAGNCKIWDVSS